MDLVPSVMCTNERIFILFPRVWLLVWCCFVYTPLITRTCLQTGTGPTYHDLDMMQQHFHGLMQAQQNYYEHMLTQVCLPSPIPLPQVVCALRFLSMCLQVCVCVQVAMYGVHARFGDGRGLTTGYDAEAGYAYGVPPQPSSQKPSSQSNSTVTGSDAHTD